jgi:hypothetical protein
MRFLALITLLIVLIPSGIAEAQTFTEPKSKVTFDLERDGLELMGAGLRIKKIAFIKAKVYAVGLYVGKDAIAGPLAAYKGKTKTPEFYRELVQGDFPKELQLKFTRNVGEGKIQDAMRDALKGTDKVLLDQFISYFPEVKEGQECILRWAPGGTLESVMVGETKPPIENKDFAAKLFDIYVGDKPLQDDIKEGLVSRADELLK